MCVIGLMSTMVINTSEQENIWLQIWKYCQEFETNVHFEGTCSPGSTKTSLIKRRKVEYFSQFWVTHQQNVVKCSQTTCKLSSIFNQNKQKCKTNHHVALVFFSFFVFLSLHTDHGASEQFDSHWSSRADGSPLLVKSGFKQVCQPQLQFHIAETDSWLWLIKN